MISKLSLAQLLQLKEFYDFDVTDDTKAKDENKWINGGFFILKPEVFNYLEGNMDDMMWEDEPLEKLTIDNQLQAFPHTGFWKCMDALRDKIELEELWKNNEAKWKTW